MSETWCVCCLLFYSATLFHREIVHEDQMLAFVRGGGALVTGREVMGHMFKDGRHSRAGSWPWKSQQEQRVGQRQRLRQALLWTSQGSGEDAGANVSLRQGAWSLPRCWMSSRPRWAKRSWRRTRRHQNQRDSAQLCAEPLDGQSVCGDEAILGTLG